MTWDWVAVVVGAFLLVVLTAEESWDVRWISQLGACAVRFVTWGRVDISDLQLSARIAGWFVILVSLIVAATATSTSG